MIIKIHRSANDLIMLNNTGFLHQSRQETKKVAIKIRRGRSLTSAVQQVPLPLSPVVSISCFATIVTVILYVSEIANKTESIKAEAEIHRY